jgi:ribonucleoside-diphosphate reductase alpha chain
MVHGVTTGIEPVMSARYLRRYNTEEGQDSAVVEDWHSIAYPDHIEDASNMHPEAHFKMQEVVQMHVDNAVSKTINLPKDFPKEELSDLWLKYLPVIKGSTFYRWGSRDNEPIQPLGPAEVAEEVADDLAPFDPSCPDGSCEV